MYIILRLKRGYRLYLYDSYDFREDNGKQGTVVFLKINRFSLLIDLISKE